MAHLQTQFYYWHESTTPLKSSVSQTSNLTILKTVIIHNRPVKEVPAKFRICSLRRKK